MPENENFTVSFLPKEKDTASCAVCFARNADPVRPLAEPRHEVKDIYEIRVGATVLRLCKDCLASLHGKLDEAMAEAEKSKAFKPGRRQLLSDLLDPRDGPSRLTLDMAGYSAQMGRLDLLAAHIPDYEVRAALMEHYLNERPERRPEDGHEPPRLPAGMPCPAHLRNAAMDYLRHPSRLDYIATGTTDLKKKFPDDMLPWLERHGLYVLEDLARMTDKDIMSPHDVGPREVSFLYQAREHVLREKTER